MKNFKYMSLFVFMLSGISCWGMEQKNKLQKTYSFTHPVLGSFDVETNEASFNETTNRITCTMYARQQSNSEKIEIGNATICINRVDNGNLESAIHSLFIEQSEKETLLQLIKTTCKSTLPIRFIIELDMIHITHDAFKGQQVGIYMFLLGLIEVLRMYPQSIGIGAAVSLDKRSKESLYQFYKSFGARQIGGTNKFFMDLSQLDLGIFTPKSKL